VGPIAAESASADVAALQAERAAALRAIATGRDRRRIALERLDAGRQLMARGFLSSEEVRRREEALIAVDQSITDAQARATSLAAQIQRAEAARRRLPLDAELTRGQLQAQLASVQQRRAQIEAGRGYEIRAQTNGRVTALQVAVGQVLDNARPLMTITPEDPRLIAELYLPSRAVGFVNSGQAVRLLYDAFPYQRFGASAGEVTAVSATVLTPQEVHAAIRLEEPVYRVVANLSRQSVDAYGRSMALQAGMALTADIILEERSLLEWLLEPLFAMRGRM
jgi:membrane fusion protein